jgi:arylsulfatase A-like enzyme
MTPFRATKGTVYEGGFRVPAIIRWPGKVPTGKVENGIVSGLDWLPTFVAAAGDPNIVDELKTGKDLGGTTYKVHLDRYDQTDLLTGKGPSRRHAAQSPEGLGADRHQQVDCRGACGITRSIGTCAHDTSLDPLGLRPGGTFWTSQRSERSSSV